MAFIPVVGCGCGAPRASSCPSVRGTRRAFLRLAVSAAAATLLSHSAHATDKPFVGKSRREWQPEELCGSCSGSGKQTCSMCEGSGTLAIDDSVVQQEHECPNCMGKGDVRCPACIGLGLADTKGILRDGAKQGTLRMLRDGSYEILDCSAFPACDVYGAPRRNQM